MRGAGGPVDDVRYTDIRMKNGPNAIVFVLDYVDNNRPDFKGDPTRIPSIKNIQLDNITITNTGTGTPGGTGATAPADPGGASFVSTPFSAGTQGSKISSRQTGPSCRPCRGEGMWP